MYLITFLCFPLTCAGNQNTFSFTLPFILLYVTHMRIESQKRSTCTLMTERLKHFVANSNVICRCQMRFYVCKSNNWRHIALGLPVYLSVCQFVCYCVCPYTLTMPATFDLYKVNCSYLVHIFLGSSTDRRLFR